jgi:hypothetical protein
LVQNVSLVGWSGCKFDKHIHIILFMYIVYNVGCIIMRLTVHSLKLFVESDCVDLSHRNNTPTPTSTESTTVTISATLEKRPTAKATS